MVWTLKNFDRYGIINITDEYDNMGYVSTITYAPQRVHYGDMPTVPSQPGATLLEWRPNPPTTVTGDASYGRYSYTAPSSVGIIPSVSDPTLITAPVQPFTVYDGAIFKVDANDASIATIYEWQPFQHVSRTYTLPLVSGASVYKWTLYDGIVYTPLGPGDYCPISYSTANVWQLYADLVYTPATVLIAQNPQTGDKVERDENAGLLLFSFTNVTFYDSTWAQRTATGTIAIEDTDFGVPSIKQMSQSLGFSLSPIGPMTIDMEYALHYFGGDYFYLPGLETYSAGRDGDRIVNPSVLSNWSLGQYNGWQTGDVASKCLTSSEMFIILGMFQNANMWEFADGTPFGSVGQGCMMFLSSLYGSGVPRISIRNGSGDISYDSYMGCPWLPADRLSTSYGLAYQQGADRLGQQYLMENYQSMPNDGDFFAGRIRLKDPSSTNYTIT